MPEAPAALPRPLRYLLIALAAGWLVAGAVFLLQDGVTGTAWQVPVITGVTASVVAPLVAVLRDRRSRRM
ncbi:hypothetical protein KLP28_13735 [Nocardioidaceae bacterium]|nr:hypothetical protein KLP28_13735 [Nocardioidaceae bacterium]